MNALILVDLQYDFCQLGALEVPDGNAVIPVANALMPHFELVLATQDWHPANHKSFAANHLFRQPGQVIDLNGLEQILWPIHCVQESYGAELVDELDQTKISKIFQKGTDPEIDSYSGFFDNGHRKATGLGDYLKEKGVTSVFVMGLALDYCVKFTALDAQALGFKTYLVQDGCRAVNMQETDGQQAIEELKAKGVTIVDSQDVATLV
ncbi:bifunctional nicotinamidase/pyrazinamidase [Saprospira sp. CCB-QB6]|uniref:bifunctional nicotinamidase/pyrazinamidase n=1 Tax=Saprospira sp. CCB-QB6 TaxID=3023936 RepID=UPI00234BC68C|nr:bifunctional nicotinamidase/pyrazinamidase [Saprospira sp. CCB-QB6]WCL80792.1 bifunctional nicotinamidase/pyrazinamidase [Saprospira sp. CCB-QB6]